MPPKNKQNSHNGFYYFMQDFKSRQGKSFKSMQEVAEAAGPHWNKMSKEQRRPFEEKALFEKNNVKAATRMTSDGLDVDMLEREDKMEQQRIIAMKDEINCNLKMAAKGRRLYKETFVLIHINIFCYCTSQDRYYPAELAIAVFSLEDGLVQENVYHTLIQPGRLPLGYASVANLHSRETHQLPTPLSSEDENNMKEVYVEIKSFLTEHSKGSQLPVLYTDHKLMKMTQQVLNTMSIDFDDEENIFKIYDLQYMFKVLRNSVSEDVVWPSDTYSLREIEKDVNAHVKGISCEFHEGTNAMVYCSLSIVKRYLFTICDNCCMDLQIPLVPGKHVPPNASITALKSSSTLSLASSSSRSSSSLKPTTRDDDSESVVSFSSKSGWDASSVYSETSSSVLPDNDRAENYPPLAVDSSQNSYKSYSEGSTCSTTRSVRSYAGVMAPSGLSRKPAAMPSSLCDGFGKVTLSESGESSMTTEFPALGRGRARRQRK